MKSKIPSFEFPPFNFLQSEAKLLQLMQITGLMFLDRILIADNT